MRSTVTAWYVRTCVYLIEGLERPFSLDPLPSLARFYQRTLSPPRPASVPFMITRAMKQELLDRGFSLEQVRHMRPEEARRLLDT